MGRRARWIGTAALDAPALQTRCATLAEAQCADGEPILVWGRAPLPMFLGAQAGAPWVEQGQFLFLLIVPLRLAPGRARRWISWALAPAIATCRSFGVQAYLEDHALWAAGRRIADAGCTSAGACAVIACSMPCQLPDERDLEARFRAVVEAQFGWQFETSWPSPAERSAMAEAG
jgi:hypothetical protein